MRDGYSQKFTDVFDESVAFVGCDAEFILLKPQNIKGWVFEGNEPAGSFQCNFSTEPCY